jgi:hypothetical protein
MIHQKVSIEVIAYNSGYFQNHDSATPSNTPAGNKTKEVSLKSIDFTKYLENMEENIVSTDDPSFCDKAFVGDSSFESGLTKENNTKVFY